MMLLDILEQLDVNSGSILALGRDLRRVYKRFKLSEQVNPHAMRYATSLRVKGADVILHDHGRLSDTLHLIYVSSPVGSVSTFKSSYCCA